MDSFESLGLRKELLQAIAELGYDTPMPIQQKVIPLLLESHRDLVALAATGTGKTAAFGLPLLHRLDARVNAPQALVLSPTRELCMQIAKDLQRYAAYLGGEKGVGITAVYGGSSIERQIKELRRGCHVIVATPGRLNDLMERGEVPTDCLRTLVLDEADEMLSMGFAESLNAILTYLPNERDTLMFSATMNKEIEQIAASYLKDPIQVTVGRRNAATNNVEHRAYVVSAKDRYEVLKRVLDVHPEIYAIVFCRTRKETQEIADKLFHEGYHAEGLHGEVTQAQREVVMNKFRRKDLKLLIATDVAARGLDVHNLTHVIHYGLPDDFESYTHRSGRTGRAGRKGVAISVIGLREKSKLAQLAATLKIEIAPAAVPTVQEICQARLQAAMNQLLQTETDIPGLTQLTDELMQQTELLTKEELLQKMVAQTLQRITEYYRHRPNSIEADMQTDKRGKGQSKEETACRENMVRVYINLGRMDKFFPNELINVLNMCTRSRIALGKITTREDHTLLEVPREAANRVLQCFNGKMRGRRKVRANIQECTATGRQNAHPKKQRKK